jgi:hypothetical protein
MEEVSLMAWNMFLEKGIDYTQVSIFPGVGNKSTFVVNTSCEGILPLEI